MQRISKTLVLAAMTCLSTTAVILAQTYDLSWYSIDGGGALSTTGGAYSLSGTIGQPNAASSPTPGGGAFELTGGFWPGVGGTCTMPGDMNLDGHIDGDDVELFINCVISGTGSCGCADLDGGGAGTSDVPLFVDALLGG